MEAASSMRKRSQLVSVTTYTSRDASGLKHAKPSHQVQPVHQNQPHDRTNYTPRDTSGLKHAKPSHQVQPVHKNQPHDRTNCTQDASRNTRKHSQKNTPLTRR